MEGLSPEAAIYIAKGMCTLSMFGSALAEGYLIGKALEAIGRNPEVSGRIFPMMILGSALAETSAIYALVVALIM
jgi:F-type H+-transporting ATPase subunit c